MSKFHTRNITTTEEIRRGKRSAATQEQRIKEWFQAHPMTHYTAWDIWHLVFETQHVPITSVRRSLTDLDERHGKVLRKNEVDKRSGDYGSECCTYSLLPPPEQSGQYHLWPNGSYIAWGDGTGFKMQAPEHTPPIYMPEEDRE